MRWDMDASRTRQPLRGGTPGRSVPTASSARLPQHNTPTRLNTTAQNTTSSPAGRATPKIAGRVEVATVTGGGLSATASSASKARKEVMSPYWSPPSIERRIEESIGQHCAFDTLSTVATTQSSQSAHSSVASNPTNPPKYTGAPPIGYPAGAPVGLPDTRGAVPGLLLGADHSMGRSEKCVDRSEKCVARSEERIARGVAEQCLGRTDNGRIMSSMRGLPDSRGAVAGLLLGADHSMGRSEEHKARSVADELSSRRQQERVSVARELDGYGSRAQAAQHATGDTMIRDAAIAIHRSVTGSGNTGVGHEVRGCAEIRSDADLAYPRGQLDPTELASRGVASSPARSRSPVHRRFHSGSTDTVEPGSYAARRLARSRLKAAVNAVAAVSVMRGVAADSMKAEPGTLHAHFALDPTNGRGPASVTNDMYDDFTVAEAGDEGRAAQFGILSADANPHRRDSTEPEHQRSGMRKGIYDGYASPYKTTRPDSMEGVAGLTISPDSDSGTTNNSMDSFDSRGFFNENIIRSTAAIRMGSPPKQIGFRHGDMDTPEAPGGAFSGNSAAVLSPDQQRSLEAHPTPGSHLRQRHGNSGSSVKKDTGRSPLQPIYDNKQPSSGKRRCSPLPLHLGNCHDDSTRPVSLTIVDAASHTGARESDASMLGLAPSPSIADDRRSLADSVDTAAADARGPVMCPPLSLAAAGMLLNEGAAQAAVFAAMGTGMNAQTSVKVGLPGGILSPKTRIKAPYRPSDALNEDDYDFAIVVRVGKEQFNAESARAAVVSASNHGSRRRMLSPPHSTPRGAIEGKEQLEESDSASDSDTDDLSNSSDDCESSGSDSESESRGRASIGSRLISTLSRFALTSSHSFVPSRRSGVSSISNAPSSSVASRSAPGAESVHSLDHVSIGISTPSRRKRKEKAKRKKRSRRNGDHHSAQSGHITAPALSRRVTWSRMAVESDESDSEDADNIRVAGVAGIRDAMSPRSAAALESDNTRKKHLIVGATQKPIHKCSEVIAALRGAGLYAKRVRSLSRRTWLLKIRAPEWRLELEAENIHLRMRRRDGGWSRFKRSLRAAFAPTFADDDSQSVIGELASEVDRPAISLFHSSDRQTLIDHILRSSAREGGADLGETTPLGAYVTHMFPLHMIARLTELRSDWLAIWRPTRSQAAHDRVGAVDPAWYAPRKLVDISASSPAAMPANHSQGGAPCCCSRRRNVSSLSEDGTACSTMCAGENCVTLAINSVGSCCCKCTRSVGRTFSRLLSQPLDRIAAYFGETVAFYFAWLEFYTQWLVLPAIAGLFLFLGQLYNGSLDIEYVPLFSLFMAVWSILFLEFWKRRNSVLAQRWGVLNYEDEEVVRPQYVGAWKQDVSTGAVVRIYPRWKRALKYVVSVPIILAFVGAIVLVMVLVFSTRDHVLRQVQDYEATVAERAEILAWLNGTAPEVANVTLPDPVLRIDIKASIIAAWDGGFGGFVSGSASPSSGTAGASASPTSPDPNDSPHFMDALASRLYRLETFFTTRHTWKWWLSMTIPPIVYGSLMPLFSWIFNKIALIFNDWENHATESSYRNHRIAKVFFFRFVSSFVSLFYYAFSPQHSLLTLFIQLAAFLVIGQLFGNATEVGFAALKAGCRECRAKRRVTTAEDSGLAEGRRGRRLLRHAQSQAWKEARLPQYDTFHDYAEMLIQFGYVTFFSWAFPLAPLCALCNNLIEMRTDAFKLCHLTQRPIAHKAGGIGVWYNVLVSMSILAVLTNCAHLALTSKQFRIYFPNMTDAQRLLLVFVFEHIVLSLRLLMAYIIPPVPAGVNRRAARDAWALAKLQGRRSVGELSATGNISKAFI